MEKIRQFLSNDATYSTLTPILLSIYGFVFITYINRTHTIIEVNEFILSKQKAIYLLAFPDLISIPIINLNPKFWSLSKIIIGKSLILFGISLIMINLWTPSILLLSICLSFYGSINLFYIKENNYKELFYSHLVGTLISIPIIIILDHFFELDAILLFGVSNFSILIILILLFLTSENPIHSKEYDSDNTIETRKIFILVLSSILLPLLVNQYILELKTIFSDKLYYLEYYFMLSSVFATVIISPQINLVFTQKLTPQKSYNALIYLVYIFSSLFFLYLLKYINNQDVNYINLNVLIFFFSDLLRIIIFFKSRKYILNQEFHILLIFEIMSYFMLFITLIYTQSMLTYALIPLNSLFFIYLRKKWQKKEY